MYSVALGHPAEGRATAPLYLGLSNEFQPGVHGRLLRFDPNGGGFSLLVDLARFLPEAGQVLRPPHSKFHLAIAVDSDGVVYAATHVTAPPIGERVHRIYEIYNDGRRCFSGSHLLRYEPGSGRTVDMGVICPKEGVRVLAVNPELHELYALTYPRDHFVVVTADGEVYDHGRIGQDNSFGLCWCGDGCTYTTDDDGFLVRYRPGSHSGCGELERLPVRIPDAPWREGHGNCLRRMVLGPDGMTLFGAGTKGMRLFSWRPDTGAMRDYGPVAGIDQPGEYAALPSVKALAFGPDGLLYVVTVAYSGYARSADGCRLWRLEPASGWVEDLGPVGGAQARRFSNCQQAVIGADGTLYLGMQTPAPPVTMLEWLPTNREGGAG